MSTMGASASVCYNEPMPTFNDSTLLRFAERVLVAVGAPTSHAETVADHLVGANLAGHDSHGVIRLPQYRAHVREGKIDPAANPRILKESPTTALLDGNMAWGQVVAKMATDLAVERSRKYGTAAIAVRNCYHIGRVGVYALDAARAGLIAQIFCNAHGVARVAPWGGTDAKLATNPIAIAVPRRGEPVLVDITTSVVAEGKVRVAKLGGNDIPEGWILDSDGKPTTNPADLYEGGTILPFGGAQGHKGYGLGVTVDLLGGVVTNAGCGFMTKSFGNGVLFQTVDPAAFDESDAFLDRVEEYLEYLMESATLPGVAEILVPGDPELRVRDARKESGIELSSGVLEHLEELATELGVEGP